MTGACQTTTPRCHLDTWPHIGPPDLTDPILVTILPQTILVLAPHVLGSPNLDPLPLALLAVRNAPSHLHGHADAANTVTCTALGIPVEDRHVDPQLRPLETPRITIARVGQLPSPPLASAPQTQTSSDVPYLTLSRSHHVRTQT